MVYNIMKDYQLGKMYKIVCRVTGEVYVRSTCETTLSKRLVAHRSACKSYHEKKRGSFCSSFNIILRNDYYIELIEYVPCNYNEELQKKEREWYDIIECINKLRPLRTHEDLLQDKHRYRQELPEEKIEEIKQYVSDYRQNHKEERLIYDERHKEQIQEKAKQWKAANRDRINELKLINYHKNKKPPTEEEIEQERIRKDERLRKLRERRQELIAKRRLDNPNYEEEKKTRQKELHRIASLKYKQKKKAEKNTIVSINTI